MIKSRSGSANLLHFRQIGSAVVNVGNGWPIIWVSYRPHTVHVIERVLVGVGGTIPEKIAGGDDFSPSNVVPVLGVTFAINCLVKLAGINRKGGLTAIRIINIGHTVIKIPSQIIYLAAKKASEWIKRVIIRDRLVVAVGL